ncbi:MAG: hypothetical protein ACYDA1_10220, partial [Vulcanimicrobiaceae bacterium]
SDISAFFPLLPLVAVLQHLINATSNLDRATQLHILTQSAVIVLIGFALLIGCMLWIYITNARDTTNLSQEEGSSSLALPEDIARAGLFPKGYDIWSGFVADEEERRYDDRDRFQDMSRRIAEYREQQKQEEQRLHGKVKGDYDASEILRCWTDALAGKRIDLDSTPIDQDQVPKGTPAYAIDPTLLDQPT